MQGSGVGHAILRLVAGGAGGALLGGVLGAVTLGAVWYPEHVTQRSFLFFGGATPKLAFVFAAVVMAMPSIVIGALSALLRLQPSRSGVAGAVGALLCLAVVFGRGSDVSLLEAVAVVFVLAVVAMVASFVFRRSVTLP